ncbi:F-box protein At1g47340-like [Prosopis cineraria]|uniref:F-box protein At1g47340-like n=1 Tax=Prosopis cineraria TaxID=364024 RepID=UPI00240EECC8|nr:F-box protein At1g47340-like [Prosopis cineraria]
MEGDAQYLPEEVIRNILTRLPVKSLIRFQCVCKHWKNLIKSPSFIADHLHHSNLQNPLLLCEYNDRESLMNLRLLDREMQFLEVETEPLMDSLHNPMIIGSSNGLICLRLCTNKNGKYSVSLLLWNPSIREVRQIYINYLGFYLFAGFGFSPILDDYKILIIHPTRYSAQVYSVGSGSWNGVDCTILNDWHDLHDDPITVNGFMYWIGSKEDENDLFVVSFDMAMELFTLISPISPREGRGTIKLTVYENKLGLLSVISENQNSFVTNLWVMEEVTGTIRETWSWTKKYTSNPLTGMLACPVTMWNNEIVCDVYFGDECEPKIFLINITTSELKMVNDPLFNLDLCDAFNYVESLVAVGGIKSTTMFV